MKKIWTGNNNNNNKMISTISSPIFVTLDGIVTEINLDPLNILSPITVSPEVKITWEIAEHLKNERIPNEIIMIKL